MNSIIKKAMISTGVLFISYSCMVNAAPTLEKLMQPDTLGESLMKLDKQIGPAQRVDKFYHTKSYQIEYCTLTISYKEDSIQSLEVQITPQCSFNTGSVIESTKTIAANKLTLGNVSGDFYADCLYMCGNAIEPSIYRIENFNPPRYANLSNYQVMVTANTANTEGLVEQMIKQKGEDWVRENQFNCHPEKYNELASQLLKNTPVESIAIGYDLMAGKMLQQNCR